jgi:aryl-alcohol dehydrogenase-like predicted oxidoreductase
MNGLAAAPRRRLGHSGIEVAPIGLGCMGLSIAYAPGSVDDATGIEVIRRAVDLGVTLFDTSDAYGPHVNEVLVGRALAPVRDRVVIATKAGCAPNRESYVPRPDGRPDVLKAACDASLARLGIDVIDLWQLHRADPAVPIEESVGAMGEMVQAGKVRAIGLSEVTVEQLDAAWAAFPFACVQSELSLWTRDVLDAILPWCGAHDVAFVPFAPLGRGFLTGTIDEGTSFTVDDVRAVNPRFTPEARAANAAIVAGVRDVAARLGVTPAQVALAWVLAQGEAVVPIPGAGSVAHVEENVEAAGNRLDAAAIAALDGLPPAVGSRY